MMNSILPSIDSAESENSAGKRRKRKAPVSISKNACTNCRTARAKCDGSDEEACSRCIGRGMGNTCAYELRVKTAKEVLVKKIKQLENIVESLHVELKEKDTWIHAVKEVFGPGSNASAILQRNENSYQGLIDLLSQPLATSEYLQSQFVV